MMSMLVFVAVGHIVCGRAAASPPSVPCVLAAMGGWHLALSRAGRRRGSVGVQAAGGCGRSEWCAAPFDSQNVARAP